jgi:hypothetical protein
MSSFYDDASLVVIPSGYKTSKIYAEKPTDGSGDLTFTRASDATRVASNGLIEKVRTNLILQSNTFSNAAWDNIGSSETSGQTGYDGTTNAWSLIEDSSTGNHLTRQFPTVYGLTTLSVYAKAGSRDFVYLRGVQSSANVIAWFNLSTGTVGMVQTNGTGKIESVGNGWYRCSLTVANFQSPFELYVGLSNADNVTGYTGNGTGNILIQNFQYETGDIATAYIPTTTAAVSVGPVSNVPRLDYLGSTCPRLNLEPQRTNLVTFSEQMDNASWIKLNGSVTANTAVSPDGYTNADKFVPNTTSGVHALRSNIFNQSAIASHSWFVKADGYSKIAVRESELVGNYASFNLSTGALISTNATGSIVNYGNGWYRCTLVDTTIGLLAQTSIVVLPDSYTTGDPLVNWSGDGTKGVLAYGAMVEIGAYATSYIPTLAASVTRVADAASKTGISSLIGQTEGTFFVEIDLKNAPINDSYVFLRNAGVTNYLGLRIQAANLRFESVDSGVLQTAINYTINTAQTVKVAMAYKLNDFVMYVNGALVGTDTSATVPTCDILDLNFNAPTANAFGIAQTLLFKTRLTNAQLAELTTL